LAVLLFRVFVDVHISMLSILKSQI